MKLKELFQNLSENNVLKYFGTSRFFLSLIAVVVTVILVVVIRRLSAYYIRKQKEMNRENFSPEHRTLATVTSSVVSGIVILIAIIFILQLNGLQVSSLITSVSILSAILGLALQDTIKDVIQGIQILSDQFFRVGDVIKVGEYEGYVTRFSMRSTRIKDIQTRNEITIANRNLSQVEVQVERRLMEFNISYDEPVDKMMEIFGQITERLAEEETISKAKFLGLRRMDESAMVYLVAVYCTPRDGYEVMRLANRIVKQELEARSIRVPYNQLDIHLDQQR